MRAGAELEEATLVAVVPRRASVVAALAAHREPVLRNADHCAGSARTLTRLCRAAQITTGAGRPPGRRGTGPPARCAGVGTLGSMPES